MTRPPAACFKKAREQHHTVKHNKSHKTLNQPFTSSLRRTLELVAKLPGSGLEAGIAGKSATPKTLADVLYGGMNSGENIAIGMVVMAEKNGNLYHPTIMSNDATEI